MLYNYMYLEIDLVSLQLQTGLVRYSVLLRPLQKLFRLRRKSMSDYTFPCTYFNVIKVNLIIIILKMFKKENSYTPLFAILPIY